jgi:hypothetical protein
VKLEIVLTFAREATVAPFDHLRVKLSVGDANRWLQWVDSRLWPSQPF